VKCYFRRWLHALCTCIHPENAACDTCVFRDVFCDSQDCGVYRDKFSYCREHSESEIPRSFIVEVWSQILSVLGSISIFSLIRRLVPATRASYVFVDAWVLGNLLLSFVFLGVATVSPAGWWGIVFLLYPGIRMFEVVIYQVNVFLFDEYRAKKAGKEYYLRGFRRLVILSLHNYAEIVVWFAVFYRSLDWAFETHGVLLRSFLTALNFSFVTMTTFGNTTIYPSETLGYVLVLTQSVVGMFMTLVTLARFISMIPLPRSLDPFER
jgi:hypothetical protein